MMGETETMLKIFLAEDEIVMREGIRNNIAWQEEGFEFVGEASDGELAYPMIQKLKPDILITDIRMPFMDGLELSRIVKQELPDTSYLDRCGRLSAETGDQCTAFRSNQADRRKNLRQERQTGRDKKRKRTENTYKKKTVPTYRIR